MEKQFVTYDIAFKLKELGFNEPCLAYYNLHKNDSTYGFNISIVKNFNEEDPEDLLICSAPLWQQVIDFILIQYGLSIEFNVCNNAKFQYEILSWHNKFFNGSICIDSCNRDGFYKSPPFENKYIAREHAILKAIELWKNI